jgi:hypothetical protein
MAKPWEGPLDLQFSRPTQRPHAGHVFSGIIDGGAGKVFYFRGVT